MRRLLFLALALPTVARSQAPAPALTDSALVAIVTSEIQRLMNRLEVPGAVVTLIRGDQVLLKAAFGVADRERSLPVSTDSTAFRVASVAKVITAMAAVQLEHSGKLSLSEDVRRFVPDVPLDKAVSMTRLLTHTAGLDERVIGYLARDTTDSLDLARVLAERMPPQTRADTLYPGYSNDGYALAALVVERVAGMPFNRYATERIFAPLGMTSTAFIIPPLPPLRRLVAAEYHSSGTRRPFSYSPSYPAGNLATTASDMRRFLSVLLHGDSTVLPASARERLLGAVHSYHPEMPAMGLGLAGQRIAGHTMWIKGGASRSHSAVVAVIPDLDVGLFVAVNRQEPLWDRLLRAIGDSMRAGQVAPLPPPTSFLDAGGVYRLTRVPLASAVKVAGLGMQLRVNTRGDSLHVAGPEFEGVWARRGFRLYEHHDGRQLALHPGSDGVDHIVSIVQGQPVTFERVPFHQSARVQVSAGLMSVVFAVAAAIGAARRRREIGTFATTAMVGLPVMHLALFVGVLALAQQGDELAFGPTPLLYGAAGLATLAALVGIAQSLSAARASARPGLGAGFRVTFAAGALAGAVTTALLAANNLIGYRF